MPSAVGPEIVSSVAIAMVDKSRSDWMIAQQLDTSLVLITSFLRHCDFVIESDVFGPEIQSTKDVITALQKRSWDRSLTVSVGHIESIESLTVAAVYWHQLIGGHIRKRSSTDKMERIIKHFDDLYLAISAKAQADHDEQAVKDDLEEVVPSL